MSRAAPWPADNRSVRNALARIGRWIWSVRRLMLLAGALPILSFPAANLEFLAWFGLVPGLLLIVRSPSAREGGIRAWWLGAGYLIAALYWMTPEIGPAVLLVRRGVRRAVGAVRGGRGQPAQAAGDLAAGAGRARGGAELLVGHRMAQVVAGARRPVGGVRRQPVAASSRARTGCGRRRVAGQLRAGHGQRGDRARRRLPAEARPRPAPGARAAGRGRGAGQRRRRASGLRAHPGEPCRPAGHDRDGATRHYQQHGAAGGRERAADRRAEPLRHGWARSSRT